MPWQPLPRIAFAVATFPFTPQEPTDLPLELGDELYIIEQGGENGDWFRGYLVAPPSLLAGLTSSKGNTLEARVFSGIFPRSCVEVREVLGEEDISDTEDAPPISVCEVSVEASLNSEAKAASTKSLNKKSSMKLRDSARRKSRKPNLTNGSRVSADIARDPKAPKPQAPVPMLKIGDETPTSESEPLVDEIASCLREWHSTNLHELLLSRQYLLLDKMSELVQSLDLARRQLLHGVMTRHELIALREKTVWDLVQGNKLFTGEVIVRDPAEKGRLLTAGDSAVEITRLQSMMSLLEERPHPIANDNQTLHHLLVDVKTFVGTSFDNTKLVFFMAKKTPGKPAAALSESYIVNVPPSGSLASLANVGNMRTLFADLASSDIGDASSPDHEIYLVVKVQSTQQVTEMHSGSRGGSRDGQHSSSIPQTASSVGRSGRRSLMWGSKSPRNAFSRNTPVTARMDSVTENTETESSTREAMPATANSVSINLHEKSALAARSVIKTVGISAIKVNDILKNEVETEQVMTIWAPATGTGSQDTADQWQDVISDLFGGKASHFEISRRAERLQLHLRAFNHLESKALIIATPTLLSDITTTSKMGFSGAPTKPRSDIYITLDEAFLPRQALLSRATGSATPLSSNVTGSHLQVTLEVRTLNGDRLEGCIFPSSNAKSQSTWESTAAGRGEGWNQTLRLVIQPQEVAGSHLVMTIADVPSDPFAICYIPLWDQQAFLRDGHHSLLLYRYDENTNTAKGKDGRPGYLSLAWNARGKDDVSKDEAVTGPVATLRIQSYLCSTRFSQDKVLLGLLRWKDLPSTEIQELLQRLIFVPEIEIVKLLSDVLDAIFGILVEQAGHDDYEDLIFSALVTVLGIVHDRRFNVGPLVDQYAESRFNYPFASPCLVRSFTRLLAKPSDPDTSRRLRATFKVVKHILKFITHARDQQKEKEAGIGITSTSPGFTRHLRSIFKALDTLMRNTAPILVGSQTLAVQHFHTWLPELTALLSMQEIVHIAIDFMDSCSAVKGKLILYKLVLIINYSKLELFSKPGQRKVLCANTVRWIAPHWGKTDTVDQQWRDQVRLCCSVLSTQVENLANEIPNYIPKIIGSYTALLAAPKPPKLENARLSLLFPATYPFPSKPLPTPVVFDEALVELSAILSAISNRPAGMQLDLGEHEMATLLEDTLMVHLSILKCDAFPAKWLSVHIYHHKSTMKTLEYIAGILLEMFLPDPDEAESYHTELWKLFFTVLLKLMGSDVLALETFPEQKRRAVWNIAGDVREAGAELLKKTWDAIGWETAPEEKERYGLSKVGGYQVQYVPGLVGPIVGLCLSVHEGLRRVAVEVLQTMLVSEWALSEDTSIIQTEMIDCLDQLFKLKPLTESILQKLFIKELDIRFTTVVKVPDDPLYVAVQELIATISEFLDLLVSVYASDVTGEAANLISRLRLMEFLRDMQKEDIFIRYVHQLAQLQLDAGNPTEAGLSLRLHADLYNWDPTEIVPALTDPQFPAQTHFERKERIYFDMIKHLEDGEAWNSALSAYQELQIQYQENVYDFSKLARTHRAIATIYQIIGKSSKLIPKYYRVIYKGMGFPPSLRDKEFIFESHPTEKQSAFTERMQAIHPTVQVITTGEVQSVEGQFLQIFHVSPHKDLEHPVLQRAKVARPVRDYLMSSFPQTFSTTHRRNTSGPITEHTAEKIIYKTVERFPTVLRRSEIESTSRLQMGAIETGLERVVRKTAEIGVIERRVLDGENEMAPLLIDALQISVNAKSESNMSCYRGLLPPVVVDEHGESEEPVLTPLQNALRTALIDHAIMIKRCIMMFSQPERQSLLGEVERETLNQNFESSFAPELNSYAFPQHMTNPHSPISCAIWSLSSPVQSRTSQPSNAQMMGLGIDATFTTSETGILDSPAARAGKKRTSFRNRYHERQKSTMSAQAISVASTTRILAPMVNGNIANNDKNDSIDNSGLEYRVKSSISTESTQLSHSRENSSIRNGDNSKDYDVSKRKSFLHSSSLGRSNSRSTRDQDDENGDWMTKTDLPSRHGSVKLKRDDNRGEVSAGSSPGSAKGSFGKAAVGVRKRLSLVGFGLGKKKSLGGLIANVVTEEE